MKTLRELIAFYIPLAIQGASMSLTYPLVGSVVSHGRLGPDEYAVFAQSQAVMFLVGSIGNGLITTGMVFGRSRTGFLNNNKLAFLLGGAAALMQLACSLPPLDNLVFGRLYHLGGELFDIARETLLWSIPLNFAFFIRTPMLATLFSEKRSDKATLATAARILLVWLGSIVFVKAGLVGWHYGLLLTTASVFAEAALFFVFARPYSRKLEDAPDAEKASIGQQCRFTIPLSLGGTMINVSAVMIGVFLSMTDNPELSRAIHYIAMGIMNPLGNAAMRMQAVTIAFPPAKYGFWTIQGFALAAGVALSGFSILLQHPSLANWYFCGVQNLAPEHVGLAKIVVLVIATVPIVQAVRGHAEGLAAILRRPKAILAGQISYLAMLVAVFFLLIQTHLTPGYMAGAISIALAQFASFAVIRLCLPSIAQKTWGEDR